MTKKHKIRDLAAAILIHHNRMLGVHIDELTKMVMESKLSILGLRGETPPKQTLTSTLGKETGYFRVAMRGRYQITGMNVGTFPEVRDAVLAYKKYLESRDKELSKDDQISTLKAQLEASLLCNNELMEKIKQILDICDSSFNDQ